MNLIDLAIGVFCLLLVPLGYGAYKLFRPPTPTIRAVEPGRALQAAKLRVRVSGTNFRPFLRASAGGTTPDAVLLVESPTEAQVELSALEPGAHDLVLYDDSREVARKVNAITVLPPPAPPLYSVSLLAVGVFTSATEAQTKQISIGSRFPAGSEPPVVQVVDVRPATAAFVRVATATGALDRPVTGIVNVPAALHVQCTPVGNECKFGEVVLAAGATLTIPSGNGLQFRVVDVGPVGSTPSLPLGTNVRNAEVDVRFVTAPGSIDLLRQGASDTDRRIYLSWGPVAAATLVTFRKERDFEARTMLDWSGPDRSGAYEIREVPRSLSMIDATLNVPVERVRDGWMYKGSSVKLGAPFTFEGPLYMLRGWVVQVRMPTR